MKSAETALSFLFKLAEKDNIKGQASFGMTMASHMASVFTLPPAGEKTLHDLETLLDTHYVSYMMAIKQPTIWL